jgi:BED zinc finger
MGPGLNLETPEEIDAPIETQNLNAPEEPTKKRKHSQTYSDVCKYFKRGEMRDDGSYEAICNYCGKYYKQGNQRRTRYLKHHIMKGCKKIPWVKRYNKVNALQKMLQTGNTIGKIQIIILTY